MTKKDLSAYMAKIGKKGGKKSRRTLSPETARKMQQASIKAKLNNNKSLEK
jgi:hypothetical protein